MKKIIILLIIISTIPLITSAQNIGDIQASFCNEKIQQTNLDIITQANKETNICIKFKNSSIKDINLTVDFVDGAITPQGSKACFSAEKPKLNFGQHVLNYDTSITVPAQQEIQKTYQIKFPVGFSGVSHGCIAYNINNSNNIAGGISLVFRKVHTIDILVGGTEIKSKINTKNIILYSSGYSNRLSLDIINNGNIDQTINLSGTISNILGYINTFTIEKQNLKAQETITLTTEIKDLPNYKGLFHINANLSYTPIFNFDITNHDIPNEYINPGTINISKNIILRNIYYIITILIIITLLGIIINKYRK